MSRIRSPYKKLLFSLVIVFVLILTTEIVLRWSGAELRQEEKFFVDLYDPVQRLVAGAANPYSDVQEFLNSSGMRGPEFNRKKASGTFRIVCLGDSQTFGMVPYEDSYPKLLQDNLNKTDGAQRFEVINAGIPGTNIYQQRLFFAEYFTDVDLDLLLVMSGPNCRSDLKAYRDAMKDPWNRKIRAANRKLARFAVYRGLRGLLKGGSSPEVLDDSQLQFVGGRCAEPDYRADYIEDLRGLLDIARRRGFQMAFVTPTDQVFIDKLSEMRLSPDDPHFRDKALASFFDPDMTSFAKRNGIPYLEYWEAFVRHAGEDLWIDPNHANGAGNRLVAESIARDLVELKLVPAPKP